MERRRPRLILIQGGPSTEVGPVTRLGLRNPSAPAWVLWGAVITKVILLVSVLAAIHMFRH